MGRIVPTRAPAGTAVRRRLAVDPASDLLRGARQVPSPNCDDRPAGSVAELIVVHGISLPPGRFGGPYIDQLFTNALNPTGHAYFREIARLKVSSHFLIRRAGEVVQYVPVRRRAWHAGKSSYRGRERCNDYSVGIELEGTDDRAYTRAQYRRLATLIRALRRAVPTLTQAPIVGHSDVAPGRKTDPGPTFDWARLQLLLARSGSPGRGAGRRPARKSR
ncbi:MAG: 1,6-anhydro-N-acetylmuramyl-L-alanine amidase AmpD [Gammaproteobacteria bacterium]